MTDEEKPKETEPKPEDNRLTVTITIDGMARLTDLIAAIYSGGGNGSNFGSMMSGIPGIPRMPSAPPIRRRSNITTADLFGDANPEPLVPEPEITADGSQVFGENLTCPGHEYEITGIERGVTTLKCKKCPHVLTITGTVITTDKGGEQIGGQQSRETRTAGEGKEPDTGQG